MKAKLAKIDYIVSLNKQYEQRIGDLETNLKINKDIIIGLVDAIKENEY